MITSLLETIFKDRLCKIAKGEGLANLLEMLLVLVGTVKVIRVPPLLSETSFVCCVSKLVLK